MVPWYYFISICVTNFKIKERPAENICSGLRLFALSAETVDEAEMKDEAAMVDKAVIVQEYPSDTGIY